MGEWPSYATMWSLCDPHHKLTRLTPNYSLMATKGTHIASNQQFSLGCRDPFSQ